MKSKRNLRKFIDKKVQEIKELQNQNHATQNMNVAKETNHKKNVWPEPLEGSYLNYAASPIDRHHYELQEKNANSKNPPAYIVFQAMYENEPLMVIRAGKFTGVFLGEKRISCLNEEPPSLEFWKALHCSMCPDDLFEDCNFECCTDFRSRAAITKELQREFEFGRKVCLKNLKEFHSIENDSTLSFYEKRKKYAELFNETIKNSQELQEELMKNQRDAYYEFALEEVLG